MWQLVVAIISLAFLFIADTCLKVAWVGGARLLCTHYTVRIERSVPMPVDAYLDAMRV